MKPLIIVAVLLIVFGVVGLVSPQIGYTTKEKVLDLGPIEATAEKQHVLSIPQAAGVFAVVGGIVMLIVGYKRA